MFTSNLVRCSNAAEYLANYYKYFIIVYPYLITNVVIGSYFHFISSTAFCKEKKIASRDKPTPQIFSANFVNMTKESVNCELCSKQLNKSNLRVHMHYMHSDQSKLDRV
jgi:hypothetical protein